MRSSSLKTAISLVFFTAPIGPAARASDGGPRGEAGTGTIRGQVSYEGERPPVETFRIDVDASVCGARQRISSEEIVVSPRGDLANVAVFLADAPATSRPKQHPSLGQRNCVFFPHVQTVTVGSELAIGNGDPIIHNVHATSDDRTVFNLAMPLKDVDVKRELGETGLITLRCDSGHTWMKAFIVVLDHPFHATTDASGAFEIPNVPPGTYALRAWHERFGMLEQSVAVKADAEAKVSLAFSKASLPEGAEGESALALSRTSVAANAGPAATAPSADVIALREAIRLSRRAEIRQRGRALYARHCAACHGDNGDGRGEQAPFCDRKPRDFTRGEFEFRTTSSGSLARIDDLARTISLGLRGTDMPAWSPTLGRDEIQLLAEFVTTFSPRYAKLDPPPPLNLVPETPADPASKARGKELYRKLQCAQCHGRTARGDGISNTVAAATAARATDIASGRFKGGVGAPAIFRAIATGLSGTSMPSFLGLATQQDLWDVAHYVDSLKQPKGVLEYLFRDSAGRKSVP
jgi:mono/diheme cytochrome c family protein